MANAKGVGWNKAIPLFDIELDNGITICSVPATEILRYGSIGDSIVREYMVQAFAKEKHKVVLANSLQQLKPKMPLSMERCIQLLMDKYKRPLSAQECTCMQETYLLIERHFGH